MHQPMQGAGAQVNQESKHWILTRDTMQTIITTLDLNRMTLKEARLYYSVYGVEVKGRTKLQFIKNLVKLVNGA